MKNANPWNSRFSMSAFATAERRRREELLALRDHLRDQDQPQPKTTDEPVVVQPPAQQPYPPPPHALAERKPHDDDDQRSGSRQDIRGSAGEAVLSPPTLDDPALYGLAGRIVRSLAPHSEADPVALLLQFLAAFGNLAGPGPHSLVGSTRHGLNLFVILVGESSKARKGTSWRQIAGLFTEVDHPWITHRVTTHRPTANTVLQALHDQQPPTDRRLFLLSEEFASILHLLGRETGQLSPLLRCAWDGGDLSAHDGRRLLHATAAHISLVGHVTQSELLHHIGRTESHNGFANRCLWTSVHRSQSLPNGGALPPHELSALAHELLHALDWIHAQTSLQFRRTPAAQELWNHRYPSLSQGRPNVYGAATSRAEAQVLRLSTIYSALDRSPEVDVCHLQAALAVWDYCRASARLFFDTAPIDPAASRISQALDVNPKGLSKTQIRGLFHKHISKERIDLALQQLISQGLIYDQTSPGPGRHATLWAKVSKAADATP